jgi:hypothetical protein
MTQAHFARHGLLYWIGMTLLGAWNVGMIVLAVLAAREYQACMADDRIICFDLAGPLIVLMLAGDGLVGLIVWLVSSLRRRRDARRPRRGRLGAQPSSSASPIRIPSGPRM